MNKKSSKEPELLNKYSRQKNKEGLLEVAEMLKHPLSLEQAKEQTRKFLRPINEEGNKMEENIERDEHKRKIFQISPQRKELLLSLEELDIQTIIEALELTIRKLLADNAAEMLTEDNGIKRFEEWRDWAKNRDVGVTTIARHPIINCIRKNLIKPLEEQIKVFKGDSNSLRIEEKLNYYKKLVRKLKFEEGEYLNK